MGNKAYIQSHLKSCMKCGCTDYRVLTFHHRDPKQKLYNVKEMKHRRFTRRQIDEEIAKCDVLCYNDHRIEHWKMSRGGG